VSRPSRLESDEVDQWLAAHPSWQLADAHLVREFATRHYGDAVEIVRSQVEIAERLDHHPLLCVGYRSLRVELWTHDRNALTALDLAYAEAFDELVASHFADVVVS